ncbi:hypothetical protein CC1G_07166 [Coprinopsis cinerea okayama7|uniref:CBM1 domain-containing protein n=1 Tax=Coprinopsis cinerea (strain Okayama-7 / 130 / ATCC MYA-4618 / FGSC 9003) TaxID=240176 RepID=A8NRB3_COPC7|nr:hypothetical protein CC1G_07166 [Coprinopsis cinerea okayama7\|eukprot:XP_001835742.1 hypothetical protein CC1G_07166 [Coprinopsis cinerea okayama7\
MLGLPWVFLSLLAVSANAGRIVWDGSFNNYTTPADFDRWSWANQVGTYQWYIKGSGPTSRYLNLDPSYKNPAITSELRGLKVTIDTTATWNSQMMRTELIPQTNANLGQGNLFYHFSIKRTNTNAPDPTLEHQVMFFESHFTELKYGVGSNPSNLGWYAGGTERWSTPFTADTWFNFAYDIDFTAKTVGLWASTNGNPLVKVVQNVPANTFTDSRDFHVGVLRIVNRNPPEDWYVSGVYIEEGPITTQIGDGSSPGPEPPVVTNPPPVTTPPVVTPPPPVTTTTPSGPLQTKYGQCGGNGYTGPTNCVEGTTCVAVSPPYYYQCQ